MEENTEYKIEGCDKKWEALEKAGEKIKNKNILGKERKANLLRYMLSSLIGIVIEGEIRGRWRRRRQLLMILRSMWLRYCKI